MNIIVIGINHKTAPVDIREKVVFSSEEIKSCLSDLINGELLTEAVLLSTCNRTELYGILPHGSGDISHITAYLNAVKGVDYFKGEYIYIYRGERAITHLYGVISGIDSMIVGEPQIFGQVKEAYKLAVEANATKIFFNKLFHTAFHVGKRVRTEASIGVGGVSVSYVAVELALRLFKDLKSHNVLLIGAGETGKLALLHLRKKNIGTPHIANRTYARAEKVAYELGGIAIHFEQIAEIIPSIDLIISATSSPEPIFSFTAFRSIVEKRSKRPLIVIDLSVPRDFDPAIRTIDNVTYHDMDSLQLIAERNTKKREEALPLAENIITEEVTKFQNWYETQVVMPLIKSLREKFLNLALQEVHRNKKHFPATEQKHLEIFASNLVNKLLHTPTVHLKESQSDGNISITQLQIIQEFFDLDLPMLEEVSPKSKKPQESVA